jgi:tetratricopeptide (TPR) repeat protein
MSSNPPDVFVSYNRADRGWAEWIAWVLEEAGYSVKLQAWDFRPGGNFVLAMQEATRARHTVAVLSPSYLAAEYTQPEWAAAFARDPQGRERTLIPVRVQESQPDGLLGQIIYADLVGLDEATARTALLAVFAERGKPPTQPPFPGRGLPTAPRLKPDFPAAPRISIAKLPSTGETFVAREDELARLDAAWEGGTNVITFVALGGAGKSALVNRWLDGLQRDGWRGAERVLGWSFYSQGTDAAGASSEAFSQYALDWLGYKGEPITSPWKKGEVLAGLLRDARTLLLLDGLEPLQHPPGAQTGRIKDPAVQALVRELAAENPGLCVITTRLAVADVAGKAGTAAVDLEELPPAAGAELLKKLGVRRGKEEELRSASEELRGHGLALTLLGTYLRDVCDGDVRRRREVTVLDAGIEGSEHARHVMAAYERWLGGAARQVLNLLGLFDRPAEAAAVAALRAAPEIPGLTAGIGAGEEKTWRLALANLRKARLVAPAEHGDTRDAGALDAHPLVREHFGERLRQDAPEAWRAGNERLYEHYRKAAPEYPETLEAMLPLYAAVVHGCRAGRVQEACAEVYWRRIRRGNEAFSLRKLGAFGAELTALAAIFDRPWDRPSARLAAADRAWLLNEAGFDLRALGRLREAVQPMRASTDMDIERGDFNGAARSAGNIGGLTLTLGDVAGAVSTGEESVVLADRSGDAFMRMVNRTVLADALHQAGQWEESAAALRAAEAMQAERQPGYPRLYSLQGYRYCDLLLGRAEPEDGSGLEGVGAPYRKACKEVQKRAGETLQWAIRNELSLLTIALDHLSLGRAHLGLALTAPAARLDLRPAAEHLDQAVDGLRQAGQEDELVRGLLARAALRWRASDFPAAAADLREAQEIAERGSMRLFEADAHLEWTRLHLATGDPATARRHLDRARELVRACGYGRREREVAWLESRLGGQS